MHALIVLQILNPTPPAIVLQRYSGLIEVTVLQKDMELLIHEFSNDGNANNSDIIIWDISGHKFTLQGEQVILEEQADLDEVRRTLMMFAGSIQGFDPAVLCATNDISEMFATYVTQAEQGADGKPPSAAQPPHEHNPTTRLP